MPECQAVLSDLQAAAGPLYFLLVIAAGALIWQWVDDYKRDRICEACNHCQAKIHGRPDRLPPPSSGVGT